MGRTATTFLVTAAGMAAALIGAAQAQADTLSDLRARTPEQEIVYFVLPDRFANGDPKNDRGGLKGTPLLEPWKKARRRIGRRVTLHIRSGS